MTTFAFLGDSITLGVREGVTAAERFSCLVCLNRGAIEVNAGVGGNNSSQGLARLGADVLAYSPDWVSLMFGTNDASLYNGVVEVDVATFESNMRAMIVQCQAAGAKVCLMTPPLDGGAELEARLQPYLQVVRKLASEYAARLLDVHAASCEFKVLDAGGWSGLMLDNDHPNPAGHAWIAGLFNLPQNADICPMSQGDDVQAKALINLSGTAYSAAPGAMNIESVSRLGVGLVQVNFIAPLAPGFSVAVTSADEGSVYVFERASSRAADGKSIVIGARRVDMSTAIDWPMNLTVN